MGSDAELFPLQRGCVCTRLVSAMRDPLPPCSTCTAYYLHCPHHLCRRAQAIVRMQALTNE
jgi:hypothetical protein